jgi:hypothetical protein
LEGKYSQTLLESPMNQTLNFHSSDLNTYK